MGGVVQSLAVRGLCTAVCLLLVVGCNELNPDYDSPADGGDTAENGTGDSDSESSSGEETGTGTGSTDTGSTDDAGCVPEAEVCDGMDNDCDGKADEFSPDNAGCNGCKSTLEGGVAYYFCPIDTTWDEARQDCEAFGATLTSIADKAENDLIRGGLDASSIGEAWIGLSDIAQEDQFEWEDGSPLSFEPWKSGQPDDFDGMEDCVEIEADGSWNDLPCDEIRPGYACRDPNP